MPTGDGSTGGPRTTATDHRGAARRHCDVAGNCTGDQVDAISTRAVSHGRRLLREAPVR